MSLVRAQIMARSEADQEQYKTLIERNKEAQREMMELQERQRLSNEDPDKKVRTDHGSQSKKSQGAKMS